MNKGRKESRQFNISVEGINCERLYFEHLAKLINESGSNKYNAKINCNKISPDQFAKRNAHRPVEKRGNKKIPYLHVQDIEDYHDEERRKTFYQLIDEIRATEKNYGISYKLGYTNYTFELWMLLHVTGMRAPVSSRTAYLRSVNQYFHRNYSSLDEFKSEREFINILLEFVTLDSVKKAVERAETLIRDNEATGKRFENYKGFKFYRDNPDLTVHEIIQLIFEVCGV
ncbi:MAG: RloB domain-containing protein [Blautia sp.]